MNTRIPSSASSNIPMTSSLNMLKCRRAEIVNHAEVVRQQHRERQRLLLTWATNRDAAGRASLRMLRQQVRDDSDVDRTIVTMIKTIEENRLWFTSEEAVALVASMSSTLQTGGLCILFSRVVDAYRLEAVCKASTICGNYNAFFCYFHGSGTIQRGHLSRSFYQEIKEMPVADLSRPASVPFPAALS